MRTKEIENSKTIRIKGLLPCCSKTTTGPKKENQAHHKKKIKRIIRTSKKRT